MSKYSAIATCLLLAGCGQLDSLLYLPETTPQQWCDAMPCVEIFSSGIILNQPVSSLLVYSLGILWLWAAWRFWAIEKRPVAATWWAVAMVFGGIAALSAGTSYQAFGYELKCAGRTLCTWTSWWEIAYLLLQNCSMNAMLVAVAYTSTTGPTQRRLVLFASINTILYFAVLAVGIYLANRLMISFEMLVLFSMPAFFLYFFINGLGYLRHGQTMDKVLLGAWVIMVVTNAIYYVYLLLGITEALWETGLWFSANDVLHVLMAVWVFYMGTVIVRVVDSEGGKLR